MNASFYFQYTTLDTCTCVTYSKTNSFRMIIVWSKFRWMLWTVFLSFSLIIRDHHVLNIQGLFWSFLFFCSFTLILYWISICVVCSLLWDSYLDETHYNLLMLWALLLSCVNDRFIDPGAKLILLIMTMIADHRELRFCTTPPVFSTPSDG